MGDKEPIGKLPPPSMQDMLDGKTPDSVLALPKGEDGMPMITNTDDGKPKGQAALLAWQARLMEEDRLGATVQREPGDYQGGMYKPRPKPKTPPRDYLLEDLEDEDLGMGGRRQPGRRTPRLQYTTETTTPETTTETEL